MPHATWWRLPGLTTVGLTLLTYLNLADMHTLSHSLEYTFDFKVIHIFPKMINWVEISNIWTNWLKHVQSRQWASRQTAWDIAEFMRSGKTAFRWCIEFDGRTKRQCIRHWVWMDTHNQGISEFLIRPFSDNIILALCILSTGNINQLMQ